MQCYAFKLLSPAVAQLVEVLCHKTGGSEFDSRQVPWKFLSLISLPSAFNGPLNLHEK
jgi:hypothetical protein